MEPTGQPGVETQVGIDLAEVSRFRRLTTSCLVAWTLFTLFHFLGGHPIAVYIHLAAAVLTGLVLAFGFHATGPQRLKVAAHANLVVAVLALAGHSYNGALLNDAPWFLVLVPLFAAYQLGERAAKIWTVLTVLVLLVLALLNSQFAPQPEWVPGLAEHSRNRVILLALVAVFGVASSRATALQLASARESQRLHKKASEAKTEFLAVMSHELRTPLNAILGFSEMMEDEIPGPLNSKQLRYQRNVSRSANNLLTLVNDVLALSKADAGELRLNLEVVDLAKLIEQVFAELEPLAQQGSLELHADVDELPSISCDRRRIHQVLVNLLNNAIKFTPEQGKIEVAGKVEGDLVKVCVEDTGIGLKSTKLDEVFERFSQVDSSHSRSYGGSGLGLAICREFIEAHDGVIWAESDGLGKGTRLCFTLPTGTVTDS